jgi:hypothetical protein
MFSRIYILPLALITLGGARLASASSYDEGQWVTTFTAGSHLIPSETFTPQASATIDLGSIDPALTGVPATTTLDHLSFHDAFTAGAAFGIETGYVAQSNLEPFLRLSYSTMRGRTTSMGGISSPALASPGMITADFDDMNSWALNLGTRYFLADTGSVRAFVAGYVGADRVDALRGNLAISGMPEGAIHEEFLPQKTSFDAGVEGGVSWQIANQADLSLAVGAQYVDARHSTTDAFAPLGIDEVKLSDQRWSVPVSLGLDYRF